MITILYIFKDKEVGRVKKSLDSLLCQTHKGFKVLLVDFGSGADKSTEIQNVLKQYSFVEYLYSYHLHQPWSRSKAINIGLRQVSTPYVFVADIDMLFHKEFVATLNDLKSSDRAHYFKVGFLTENESKINKDFEDYSIAFTSSIGAQGLSLFPTEALLSIRGFDEFFHFWGSEDEDVHARLKMNGLKVNFFDKKVLMLHQWHPTYRNSLEKKLTTSLQHNTISKINQEHFRTNSMLNDGIVNTENWGNVITKNQFENLAKPDVFLNVQNKKPEIDNFLFSVLPKLNNQILEVLIQEDPYPKTLKYHIKRFLGKSIPEYYSLKEINDVLLLHLISFYPDAVYKYVVGEDLTSITLTLQLQ
ncbi:glycosyltransferase family A protein [Flavobacterium aquidurense]|uniref:glycosyltransferase family 2 protein n=1 Tax=Flavobacterium aquidurense TaxID=362413 RepID=UPI00285B0582|nr:glycosyltransferase family A protein [Flavobacterium aquidurense]MDR7372325.1 hypothetical protein [Flavobacterium aquidurense]